MEELRNRLAVQKRRLNCVSDEANGIIDEKLVDNIQCNLFEVWDKILELLSSFAEVASSEEFGEVLEDVNGLQTVCVSTKTRLAAALLPDAGGQLDLENFEVELPTFKGGYLSWIKFRRIFRSCVVENDEYDDDEKLDILKRLVVVGRPLAVIQHEGNFPKCWDLLHQMYHNRREIADALAKEILQLPTLYHNEKSVKAVINAFKEIYSGFNELCIFNLWDVLTTNMLIKLLEEDIVSLWRAKLQDGFIPSLDNLLQFLDQLCS